MKSINGIEVHPENQAFHYKSSLVSSLDGNAWILWKVWQTKSSIERRPSTVGQIRGPCSRQCNTAVTLLSWLHPWSFPPPPYNIEVGDLFTKKPSHCSTVTGHTIFNHSSQVFPSLPVFHHHLSSLLLVPVWSRVVCPLPPLYWALGTLPSPSSTTNPLICVLPTDPGAASTPSFLLQNLELVSCRTRMGERMGCSVAEGDSWGPVLLLASAAATLGPRRHSPPPPHW